MKTLILTLCLYLCGLCSATAQYNTNQNKVWAFGHWGGIDFTSGVAVPVATAIHSSEGCASVCDKDGNLLFYTEGRTVWDNTHAIMPAGDSICPFITSSSSQSTVIAPVLNYAAGSEPTQYYVFSVQGMEDYTGGDTTALNVYYSIVDMTLNAGHGDILPGSSGKLLASRMCEKIITIPGANCDMWLLLHAIEQPVFYAYNISACGLSAEPVISVSGEMPGWYSYGFGVMKSAHDNRKIAIFNPSASVNESGFPLDYPNMGTELHDFDPATGVVSNCFRVSANRADGYGEFSPDNSKLYVVYNNDTGFMVAQYDITDTASLKASEYKLATSNVMSDMRLAPDGMIYFRANAFSEYLSLIAAPNAAGAACDYQYGAFSIFAIGHVSLSMTNLYNAPTLTISDTSYTMSDTVVCFEATDTVMLTAPFTGCLRWYDESTLAAAPVTTEGHYNVTSINGCIAHRHTFNVIAEDMPCKPSGVRDIVGEGISFYPNPATSECIIHSASSFPLGASVRIYDVTGRLLRAHVLSGNSATIPLAGIPEGVYQLRINLPEGVISERLVVVR